MFQTEWNSLKIHSSLHLIVSELWTGFNKYLMRLCLVEKIVSFNTKVYLSNVAVKICLIKWKDGQYPHHRLLSIHDWKLVVTC